MQIVTTKPVITTTFLVVDENFNVVSSHPQSVEIRSINADSFLQGLSYLISVKEGLNSLGGRIPCGTISEFSSLDFSDARNSMYIPLIFDDI